MVKTFPWKNLVKTSIQTREYPGYRYIFFQSEEELDKYFCELIGDHWRSEPWAQYLLSTTQSRDEGDKYASVALSEKLDNIRLRRQPKRRKQSKPAKVSKFVVDSLIQQLSKKNLSLRGIKKELWHSYSISRSHEYIRGVLGDVKISVDGRDSENQ